MSISLTLRSVSREQASALRQGRINPDEILTPENASYDGSGDVTHLGCGCVLTLVVLFCCVVNVWRLFGWIIAMAVFVVFEIMVIAYAWQIRQANRRTTDIASLDPLLLIPDDAELCLFNWHAFHYLLTGTDWEGDLPNAFLLHGGELLPEQDDMGEYGPPRLVDTAELGPILDAIQTLDLTDAVSRLERATEEHTLHPGTFHQQELANELQALTHLITSAIEQEHSIVISMA
ncbi:MAG: DUF1877 family protein [Pirellulales bacterium]|nr:DUF1877 family protein [Pirellulales bacterium]